MGETLERRFAKHMAYMVNSYSMENAREFIKEIILESENTQIFFTRICVEWYRELSIIEHYDMRNGASVKLGKILAKHIYNTNIEIDEIYERYSEAIGSFLVVDAKKFVKEMAEEHRTLQQSFTELCNIFMGKLIEMSREHYVNRGCLELAEELHPLIENYGRLPLI